VTSADERVNFALETDGPGAALDDEAVLAMTDRVGALGGEFHRGHAGEAIVSGWVPVVVPDLVPV